MTVKTIRTNQTEVVSINGLIFARNDLVAIGCILRLPPRREWHIFGITLHDENRALSGPNELYEILGTNPEFLETEALGISEVDVEIDGFVGDGNWILLLHTTLSMYTRIEKERGTMNERMKRNKLNHLRQLQHQESREQPY